MKPRFLPLLSLLTLLILAACQVKPSETALCFETISNGDHYSQDQRNDPGRTILINSREEAAQLSSVFSQRLLDLLTDVDYDHYFVVALLRGSYSSNGYNIIVERVARQEKGIVLYVQLWEPSPWYAVTAAGTAPYTLIKVLRDGGELQESQLAIQGRVLTPTPPAEIRARPGEIIPTHPPPLVGQVFDTIELNTAFTETAAYSGPLQAFLIRSPADVDRLRGLVSQKTLDALAGLDYRQLFAAAIIGREPAGSEYVEVIHDLIWQEANLMLFLQRRGADGGAGGQSIGSAYHVITAQRGRMPVDTAIVGIEHRPIFPQTPTPLPCR